MAESEVVVFDRPGPCSYLAGQTARLPMRAPLGQLTPERLDQCLAEGDRRSGAYLYRTHCPMCAACEPLRLPVSDFHPSASQRRVLNRGDRIFEIDITAPRVDSERVALFNRHRRQRGLAHRDGNMSPEEYRDFLVTTCCDTFEICYHDQGNLVAVAICDRGSQSLSAVYTYFEPDYARWSPGVYSVLTQWRLCRQWRFSYLYLGFYVAASPHMSYKSQYLPHERLIKGHWVRFTSFG